MKRAIGEWLKDRPSESRRFYIGSFLFAMLVLQPIMDRLL